MWLGLSLAGFALAVSLHAIFARIGGSLTIVLSFLSVGIPVAVLIALVALWMFGFSDESIAAVLVYLALCESSIFLFTLAANGVSVSLMMRLETRPATAEALMELYSTRAMVERRIDQLQAGGFLTEEGGRSICSSVADVSFARSGSCGASSSIPELPAPSKPNRAGGPPRRQS